jgi:hypothetical protein
MDFCEGWVLDSFDKIGCPLIGVRGSYRHRILGRRRGTVRSGCGWRRGILHGSAVATFQFDVAGWLRAPGLLISVELSAYLLVAVRGDDVQVFAFS